MPKSDFQDRIKQFQDLIDKSNHIVFSDELGFPLKVEYLILGVKTDFIISMMYNLKNISLNIY